MVTKRMMTPERLQEIFEAWCFAGYIDDAVISELIVTVRQLQTHVATLEAELDIEQAKDESP